MWIVTINGFISLVQDKHDPEKLQVRARLSEDITANFPGAEIVETPRGDYRYRAVIDRKVVAETLAGQILNEVTYKSHFKDVALARSKSETRAKRQSAYYGTWTAMGRMQPGGPYAEVSWSTSKSKFTGSRDDHFYGEPTLKDLLGREYEDDIARALDRDTPEPPEDLLITLYETFQDSDWDIMDESALFIPTQDGGVLVSETVNDEDEVTGWLWKKIALSHNGGYIVEETGEDSDYEQAMSDVTALVKE